MVGTGKKKSTTSRKKKSSSSSSASVKKKARTPAKKTPVATKKAASRKQTTSKGTGKATAKRPSLETLTKQSSGAAKNLMEHMDSVVGLPPLPGSEKAKPAEDIPISQKDLAKHRSDFFEDLLNEKKTPAKDAAKKSSKKAPATKKEKSLAEDEEINASLGTDALPAKLPPLPPLTPTEKGRLGSDERVSEKVQQEIEKEYAVEKPFDPALAVAKQKQNALDRAAASGKPKALPAADDSFKLEKKKGFFAKIFGKKEKPILSDEEKAHLERLKVDKAAQHGHPPKPDVVPAKINKKKTVVDEETLPKIASGEESIEFIEVPKPKDFPKPEKKGWFGKNKEAAAPEQSKQSLPTPAAVQESKERMDVDLQSLPKIASGDVPAEEEEQPKADDFTNQVSAQPNVVPVDGSLPSSVSQMEEQIASEQSMPTPYSDAKTFDPSQTQKPAEPAAPENQTDAVKETVDESSLPDIASGKTPDEHEEHPEASDFKAASGTQYENAVRMNISKLEHKRDLLESTVKELEQKRRLEEQRTQQMTHDLAAKEAMLSKKHRELDVREKELLERENVLLTLQSDMIRERKELDEREFKLFIKEEHINMTPQENPLTKVRPELRTIPEGLPPDKRRIEELMNQARKLTAEQKFREAMSTYNYITQEFPKVKLSNEEMWELSLSIKQIYNDIMLVMQQSKSN